MDWTIQLMQGFGYWGIAIVILVENLFPPIPSELVLPFAGFMTTSGSFTLVGVLTASTIGSVLGALALYGLGAWFGRDRIYRFVARFGRYLSVNVGHVQQAEDRFKRYGPWTVFFLRMVPIMRSIISIPAGLVGMNLWTFTAYTTAGALIWNLVLVGVGAVLGAAWPQVADWVGYYQNLVIALAVLVVLGFGLRMVAKKKRAS